MRGDYKKVCFLHKTRCFESLNLQILPKSRLDFDILAKVRRRSLLTTHAPKSNNSVFSKSYHSFPAYWHKIYKMAASCLFDNLIDTLIPIPRVVEL